MERSRASQATGLAAEWKSRLIACIKTRRDEKVRGGRKEMI
jgi:hypothetical protein